MPYGFQILSEEPLNQIGDNYVVNRSQMLTEVKCSKVCFTIRSLGLKHHQAIKMVTALKRMLPPNFARALAKGTVMSCFNLLRSKRAMRSSGQLATSSSLKVESFS